MVKVEHCQISASITKKELKASISSLFYNFPPNRRYSVDIFSRIGRVGLWYGKFLPTFRFRKQQRPTPVRPFPGGHPMDIRQWHI